jgi:hypothetical protein
MVKPADLAKPMSRGFGVLADIRILESEVFMVWMLGAQPYVKLTVVCHQTDL